MKLIKRMFGRVKHGLAGPQTSLAEAKYRELASTYDFCGYQRFYLVHIRKTGGTSLNHMFLALSGDDPSLLYQAMGSKEASPHHRVVRDNKIYVGWNVELINRGNYFYAFSHTPLHQLNLPPKTFTITCFRDPVNRVISHYKMLVGFRENRVDHPCMTTEGPWLGDSFRDFLQRIPPDHLLNQLYMFSKGLDIEEAVESARAVSHLMFSSDFAKGVDGINRKSGLSLKPIHIRKSEVNPEITDSDMVELREKLRPEYDFLERVRKLDD